MLVGYNYPWPANRYITIGPNTAPVGEPQQWTRDKIMASNFHALADAGVSVVRIWLMGNGHNYDGRVEFGFANERGPFWDFQPPERVHQSFLDDFTKLLDVADSEKMKLMPVLVDFGFFDYPEGEVASYPAAGRGYEPTHLDYARGRRAIASNPEYRKRFITGTVEPLLQVAASKPELIYAFDICNEPWWCIAPITGSLFGPKVNKSDMLAFLSDCLAAVKRSGLKSTIGHRYLSDVYRTYAQPKVDVPQHHYYASFPFDDLMGEQLLPKPAQVLGEFGSTTPGEFERLKADRDERQRRYDGEPPGTDRKKELKGLLDGANQQVAAFSVQIRLWPMLDGQDKYPELILPTRLTEAKARGYELAMIWPSPVEVPQLTSDVLKLSWIKLESLKQWNRRQ